MTKSDDPPRSGDARADRASARALRERRLAEALRQNLKRRKAQSRSRAAEPGGERREPGDTER